jgi:hypothetical protein
LKMAGDKKDMTLSESRALEFKEKIEAIPLTEKEIEEAIFEAKRKKFQKERFGPHWEEQENKKVR